MSLGTWGDVVFEVTADRMRTWQDMRRNGESRWAKHDVHQGKPLPEFLGPGNDTMSLSVRLDQDRGVVPADELADLREQRDIGATHDLVVGGELVFTCFLRGISEEHRRHDWRGVLTTAIVELTFEEYQ